MKHNGRNGQCGRGPATGGGRMNTQQIARKLRLSPRTIESHRKNIKTKLNLLHGAQLSRSAFQWVQENH